jgi:hypothetical protein
VGGTASQIGAAMRRIFKSLKPEYLRCRTMGHDWHDVDHLEWDHKVIYIKGFRQTSRCSSCGGYREEVWSVTSGELLCRYYKMPKGYSLAGVEVPPGTTLRQLMRLETSQRAKAAAVRHLSRGRMGGA